MSINRRKFIKGASLGFLGSLIPFQASSSILYNNFIPPLTLHQRLKKAADFRKEGRINRAINKFTQIVEDFPSEIKAYNGLRKSLLQKKFKELEVLQLYEVGYANNPDSKDFKERLAKEYMRLILGNKKFTNQYNSSENLLIRARRFFKQLKNQYPERTEYLELFKKAKRKINQQADSVDARGNIDIKTYKKNQRKKFKKRFKNRTIAEVEIKLNDLLAKPVTERRKKHIKELYRIVIQKYKKNQNWTQAFTLALALYNFDKADSISLRKVKRFANKTNNYNDLVSICQENQILQNTFWSKLGLFDAQLKRYNKIGVGNLTEINQLLVELTSEISEPQQHIEIYERSIRLAYKQQNLITAKQNLVAFGQQVSGIENVHLAVRFTILTARYFTKTQNYNNAMQVVRAVLGQSEINNTSDELLLLIADVKQEITIENQAHTTRLNQVLQKLNNRQNF